MNQVKFTATKLANTGKRGILKPDSDGYYTMPIGALNAFNSVGEYYTLEGAKELFENSSIFMRRVRNGCLKGEVGHPKKLPGMSTDDFITRILTIDETNICVHFKEIWLDFEFGKKNPNLNNNNLVAIMAKLIPSGDKGQSLQRSLDNPDENVCFSIRALTNDYFYRGRNNRVLTTIVSWDNVNEPGLASSNKWQSPGLESHNYALETMLETLVTRNNIENVINNKEKSIAMESTKVMASEALKSSFGELPKVSLLSNW